MLVNEIHYQDGGVYLRGQNTKIKIIDAHSILSCTAFKSKQDCLDRCKELDLNAQGYLTTLKYQLMCHFEKKSCRIRNKRFSTRYSKYLW